MIGATAYDVAIVGAGPAGSSLAIRLASEGLRVMLAEAKRFPRAKLCGEFISPECVAHFRELDVIHNLELAGASHILRTVFYAPDGNSVTVPSEWLGVSGAALGLSRAKMDECLLTRAVEAGVDVRCETKAAGLIFDGGKVTGVTLKGRDGPDEVRAAIVIDATGRARSLVKQVLPKMRVRADYVAFKAHLRGAQIGDGDCEIYSYRGGYGGCIAVEDGLHNLCFIVSARAAKENSSDFETIMKNVVLGNAKAAASLNNASITGECHAVPVESYGGRVVAPAEGLLSIGDAAGFIDPFTGSGILIALECSKLAARMITAELGRSGDGYEFKNLARQYSEAHVKKFRGRFRTGRLLRMAAFAPTIASITVASLSASRRLTRAIARATR